MQGTLLSPRSSEKGEGPQTLAGLSPYSLPTPERELQLGNMVLLNIQ